jgi:hypothetical protein
VSCVDRRRVPSGFHNSTAATLVGVPASRVSALVTADVGSDAPPRGCWKNLLTAESFATASRQIAERASLRRIGRRIVMSLLDSAGSYRIDLAPYWRCMELRARSNDPGWAYEPVVMLQLDTLPDTVRVDFTLHRR